MTGEDYIFRYRLDSPGEIPAGAVSPAAMAGELLRSLLDVLIPCSGDRELKVDGFKLLSGGSVVNSLYQSAPGHSGGGEKRGRDDLEFPSPASPGRGIREGYQDIKNAALFSPLIELAKKNLEILLSLVDLEYQGRPVKVDGFRLKDLGHWLVPSACDPSEVIEHIGTRCNCDCVFCYNKGAPPSLALRGPKRTASEEYEEIMTRIRYFSPGAQRSLFPGLGSTCEVLAHPHALDFLSALREKTGEPFRIATNGSALTRGNIQKLAGLKPVYLDISLNSSDPGRRKRLMRDARPETAIGSLPLLKDEGIPFSVVVVPWPLESHAEMLEDLERTAVYAGANDARMVQVSLPGHSRYFSPARPFELDDLWPAAAAKVREIRPRCGCPVVIMPGMYEEYLTRQKKNVPEVIGVVRNSPAHLAGIKPGDVITGIAGITIQNRPQARDILSLLQRGWCGAVSVRVQRGETEIEIRIDSGKHAYPYCSLTGSHLGVVFMGTGLRSGYLERLGEIIRSRGAGRVLFLSSRLVRPVFEQMVRESPFFGGFDLAIEVPENKFFGGNIFMGDLLVVEDFISCIKGYIRKKRARPDLVVIPSSPFNLGQWGRDLTGRCYLDIEREAGVPVELLECSTIYD